MSIRTFIADRLAEPTSINAIRSVFAAAFVALGGALAAGASWDVTIGATAGAAFSALAAVLTPEKKT